MILYNEILNIDNMQFFKWKFISNRDQIIFFIFYHLEYWKGYHFFFIDKC
jgi:hypothetical protein